MDHWSEEFTTLDIDDEYYDTVFDKVPNVTEDHQKIRDYNLLVDGDKNGYLIQIFSENAIGPISSNSFKEKTTKDLVKVTSTLYLEQLKEIKEGGVL